MIEPDDPSLSTGAYALGALTDEETAEFEAHLARSESLRTEVAGFADTAVELGLAAPPVMPSPDLRARIMTLAATTPQLPATGDSPATDDTPAPREPAARGAAEPAGRPALAAVPAPAHGSGAEARPSSGAEQRAEVRWFQRPGTVLAAAAAAAAVFVGGVFLGSAVQDRGSLEQIQAQASALAELNAAPDVQRASAETGDGATATLVWSGELSRSAVVFDELGALPDDRVYQAWYIDGDGTATSAGTFEADTGAATFRVLDGTLASGSLVGVTVEPDGGSGAPTTDPIVAIEAA